jgi:streptogramin lyase
LYAQVAGIEKGNGMIPKITRWLSSKRLHHGNVRSNKPGASAPEGTRQMDALFQLLVLLLAGVTVLALSSGGAVLEAQERSKGTTPAPKTHVVIGEARVIVDHVASSNVGLMQPGVDKQGNVWVGEMYANRFARFDSRSESVKTWTPPKAHYGIMDTTVDSRGYPWFVEQDANEIVRFDPATGSFRLFPLGTVGGRPLGPQDLQFDKSGLLWFTGSSAGCIGRLDPATGRVQTWSVPAPAQGISASPYSLAVTPGGQVWFGLLSGGAIGHLDPATGHVTLYHLADSQAQIFAMASSTRGRIWFTEMVPGKLGMFDPTTKKITEIPVPAISGHPAALYGLIVTPGGVWFANSGANALVRYSPTTATYTFYQLSTSYGGLYGLALDSTGRLWFTIDGTSANYIGEISSKVRGS